jgi:NADPH:quinone reductase-like Zn-dependent oxidoreductase
MKAAVRSRYGLPGDLSIKELAIPTPKDDELLIRVHAATVNRSDCHVLSGKPLVMRLLTGILKPRASIIGTDFAGEIVACGSAITSFRVGDKVMGFGGALGCGSQTQYLVLTERRAKKIMVGMPANIGFDEAAACLEGAVYASGSNHLGLKPGDKVLVYGATGAIGAAYMQFLKHQGVYITAVCRGENRQLVTALGADRIIDYTTEDFREDSERYDFILDAVGKISFLESKKLLKPKGAYTSSNGAINIFWILFTKFTGGKKVIFPPYNGIAAELNFIRSLVEKGSFVPVIDRKYPLEQIAEAYRYVASGKKIGNVVITMGV